MRGTIEFLFGSRDRFQKFLGVYVVFALLVPLGIPFFMSGSRSVVFGWMPVYVAVWMLCNIVMVITFGVVAFTFGRDRQP